MCFDPILEEKESGIIAGSLTRTHSPGANHNEYL